MADGISVPLAGETARTPVPETAVELVHGVVVYTQAVYQDVCHSLLAAIVGMLDVVCMRLVVVEAVTTKKVFLPC